MRRSFLSLKGFPVISLPLRDLTSVVPDYLNPGIYLHTEYDITIAVQGEIPPLTDQRLPFCKIAHNGDQTRWATYALLHDQRVTIFEDGEQVAVRHYKAGRSRR